MSHSLRQTLASRGCRRLVIQTGCSRVEDRRLVDDNHYGIDIELYDYKNSIARDIESADFVIGHAGAGTTLEVLRRHKPLLVVVNDHLMDNHQVELADQLAKQSYLFYCTPSSLVQTLATLDLASLQRFPDPNPQLFSRYLNKILDSQV